MKPSNMRAMIFLIFFPYTEFNSASNELIEIENEFLMKNVVFFIIFCIKTLLFVCHLMS